MTTSQLKKELDRRECDEEIEKIAPFVGKYFKEPGYKNGVFSMLSFGPDRTPNNPIFFHAKRAAVERGMTVMAILKGVRFSETDSGQFNFNPAAKEFLPIGLTEITKKEFVSAFRKFQQRLSKITLR